MDVWTEFLLYPTYAHYFIPNEIKSEYNVTENHECNTGGHDVNISLDIHLNKHILEHVPYVYIVFKIGSGVEYESEKVYLQSNRSCFSTTTNNDVTKHSTKPTVPVITNTSAVPMLISSNYATCQLHCNIQFINIPYSLFAFMMILFAVFK